MNLTTDTRSVAHTRAGLANICMLSRALKQEDNDLITHAIAKDGICIILHSSNLVNSLSGEQIRSIYTKKTRNWCYVGGQTTPLP
ncbi:MAG: substrate-binding domain-containing protein [Pseudomonadota bacterium]